MTNHNLMKEEEEGEEEVGIIHIVEFFLAKWAVLSPTQFVLSVSQTSTQQACVDPLGVPGTVLDAGNSKLSNMKGLCLG